MNNTSSSARQPKFELAQIDCKPGGWAYQSTPSFVEIDNAEQRWINRCYRPEAEDEDGNIVHQCGGCHTFAAAGADFGICWNKKSPLDGNIVFEHGGCLEHSDLTAKEKSDESSET